MEEVVGHLVDEEGRFATVGAGVFDELLAEAAEVVRIEFGQNARIARRFAGLVLAAQTFGQIQDVVQFHRPVHRRVGGQNLLQERRTGARQADDEDGVRGRAADAAAALEQGLGADLDLAVDALL